jgi:hypothetical protein
MLGAGTSSSNARPALGFARMEHYSKALVLAALRAVLSFRCSATEKSPNPTAVGGTARAPPGERAATAATGPDRSHCRDLHVFMSPEHSSGLHSIFMSPERSSGLHSIFMSPERSSGLHSIFMSPEHSSGLHSIFMSPERSSGLHSIFMSPERSSGLHSIFMSPEHSSGLHSIFMSPEHSSGLHSICGGSGLDVRTLSSCYLPALHRRQHPRQVPWPQDMPLSAPKVAKGNVICILAMLLV